MHVAVDVIGSYLCWHSYLEYVVMTQIFAQYLVQSDVEEHAIRSGERQEIHDGESKVDRIFI